MMAGTLARHRCFSDMDYTEYMNYLEHMRRSSHPGFAHRSEDVLDYKLFFARKLKSIFTEQDRLRQHVVQIADLEWDLKQHFYIYGDEYRTSRLADRYTVLQSRIQQMQDENSYLQTRTGLRLERYLIAQAALSDEHDEWCVPVRNISDLYNEADKVPVRRSRNTRILENGVTCIPSMLCQDHSTFNSEQVYDRYEDEINALYELQRRKHFDQYVKSRQGQYQKECPRTDSQRLFLKSETPFRVSGGDPHPCLVESAATAFPTSDSFQRFSVDTTEAAVQVTPTDILSTFSNSDDTRGGPTIISETVSITSLNESLPTEPSIDGYPVVLVLPAPQIVQSEASLGTAFRTISTTQSNHLLLNDSSDGGPNALFVSPPVVKPQALSANLSSNIARTPSKDLLKKASDGGSDVPLMPLPIVKPDAILGGLTRNGISRDVSEIALGGCFSNGSDPSLKDDRTLSQTTPRAEPLQRMLNIFDRLDGDFKDNLNKRQRESEDKGRPVPAWADQIINGIKRNLTERCEQSKHRDTGNGGDQDQTDSDQGDTSIDQRQRRELNLRASSPRKSRIPVRKPTKTLLYTEEHRDKVLNNVKRCMLRDRQFRIVSEYKRYGKR